MGNTDNHSSRFEIRSPSGQLLCTVAVFGAFVSTKLNGAGGHSSGSSGNSPEHSQKRPGPTASSPTVNERRVEAQEGGPTGGAKASADSRENGSMTDAQRRFLFRLLADQGIEGEKAHEHLKKFFQVRSLREVPKLEASQGIERLLHEARGGGV